LSRKTPAGITVAVVTSFALAGIGIFATCGGCRRSGPASGDTALPATDPEPDGATPKAARPPPRDPLLWANAKDGDPEDLATLATHEGAAGLVEAAADPELRLIAIRALAYAPGFSQLPFLARVAKGASADEAREALDAVVDLAARPRTSEDPEDAPELDEGCKELAALARDPKGERARRVPTIRALRMLPCPAMDIPTDLDAR
jgi:hypothetical protein